MSKLSVSGTLDTSNTDEATLQQGLTQEVASNRVTACNTSVQDGEATWSVSDVSHRPITPQQAVEVLNQSFTQAIRSAIDVTNSSYGDENQSASYIADLVEAEAEIPHIASDTDPQKLSRLLQQILRIQDIRKNCYIDLHAVDGMLKLRYTSTSVCGLSGTDVKAGVVTDITDVLNTNGFEASLDDWLIQVTEKEAVERHV